MTPTQTARERVPERIRWAIDTLAVKPDEHVLEIGCGSGVAAALVCERLVDGRMLAIDRSPLQIERARKRNEAHVSSGRLSLEAVPLEDLDVGRARFDKAFAMNVNLFWLAPARAELDALRNASAPLGLLFLFYDTPGVERTRRIVESLPPVLGAHGFQEREVVRPAPTLVCFVTEVGPAGARRSTRSPQAMRTTQPA